MYQGLFSHGTRILRITELIRSLKLMLENKASFSKIWEQKKSSVFRFARMQEEL